MISKDQKENKICTIKLFSTPLQDAVNEGNKIRFSEEEKMHFVVKIHFLV